MATAAAPLPRRVFGFGNRFGGSNKITFIRVTKNGQEKKEPTKFSFGSKTTTSNSKSISLSDNLELLEFLPRLFTITSNSGSSTFNMEFLKDVSTVIAQFLEENPQHLQYHIDIQDDKNVLDKFSQLFQGKIVEFTEEDIPISKQITELLNIINCPNFLKPDKLRSPESGSLEGNLVQISKPRLSNFLSSNIPQSYTIVTNKKEYNCNKFGVLCSEIIRETVLNDPLNDRCVCNYEDEFEEFQSICNLFNFQTVNLTHNNMDSIKDICDDLKINLVLDKVNDFINDYEKVSKILDDQQTTADTIDELFELLHNIKDLKVESVKQKIIESDWIKTEDEVIELSAFFIQAIKSSFSLHQYLLDLLSQLDKESNDQNKLSLLMPSVCEQLIFQAFGSMPQSPLSNPTGFGFSFKKEDDTKPTFGGFGAKPAGFVSSTSSAYLSCPITIYSFIYSLCKKEIIPKEELFCYLKNYRFNNHPLTAWFLPELLEINPENKQLIINKVKPKTFASKSAKPG